LVWLALLALSLAQPGQGAAPPAIEGAPAEPLPPGGLYRLGSVRLRHWVVSSLHFSPDGKQLLSTGSWPGVRCWDVRSGRLLRTIRPPTKDGFLDGLTLSPDGRHLAGADGGEVFLLDGATGKRLASWKGAKRWAALTFSADDKALIGLGVDKQVRRWDVATRKEVARRTFPLAECDRYEPCWATLSPGGDVLAGAFHKRPDGKPGGLIRFWETTNGKQRYPDLSLPNGLYGWAWAPDGRRMITLFRNYQARVWELARGKETPVGGAEVAAFSADGRSLFLGMFGHALCRHLPSGKVVWEVRVAPWVSGPGLKASTISDFAFSPDGAVVAVGCTCGYIALLDAKTGAPAGFSRRHPGLFDGHVVFSPDGRWLLTRTGGAFSLRDARTGREARRLPGARFSAWSPDGNRLAVVDYKGETGQLLVIDPNTGKERWRAPRWPSQAMFSPDGKALALIEPDGARFLDALTGREVRRFVLPQEKAKKGGQEARALEISPDGSTLAVQQADRRSLELWGLRDRKIYWSSAVPPEWGEYWSARPLPGGQRVIVSGSVGPQRGRNLLLLDAANGREVYASMGKGTAFFTASPDGRYLAVEADDAVEVREAETGRLLFKLKERAARNACIAFSPDGRLLAYNPDDYTFELREVLTGKPLARLRWTEHFTREITFAPDGRCLALSCNGATVLVWDVTGLAKEARKLPALRLTRAEVGRLYDDLAHEDGPRRDRAFWSLAANGPGTVAFLREHLRPVERPSPKQVAALLADLGGDDFAKRERASRQLEQTEGASPALREALSRRPSLELKLRLEAVLKKLEAPGDNPHVLRHVRAVQVLGQIGTPEARALLRELAGGEPGAWVTQEAQAVWDRLKARGSPQPGR
jgi:WD40 repeat protein